MSMSTDKVYLEVYQKFRELRDKIVANLTLDFGDISDKELEELARITKMIDDTLVKLETRQLH